MKIKPHIRLYRSEPDFREVKWYCAAPGGFGYGPTPAEAYARCEESSVRNAKQFGVAISIGSRP